MKLAGNTFPKFSVATFQCEIQLNQYNSYSGTVGITAQLLDSMNTVVSTMTAIGTGDIRIATFNIPIGQTGPHHVRVMVTYTGTNQQYVSNPQAKETSSVTPTPQSMCTTSFVYYHT